jgi:hypothetical protein
VTGLCIGFCTVLYIRLIAMAGAVFGSQSAYAITVAGIAWSVLLLGEALSFWTGIALLLIVTGLVLVGPKREAGNIEVEFRRRARKLDQLTHNGMVGCSLRPRRSDCAQLCQRRKSRYAWQNANELAFTPATFFPNARKSKFSAPERAIADWHESRKSNPSAARAVQPAGNSILIPASQGEFYEGYSDRRRLCGPGLGGLFF